MHYKGDSFRHEMETAIKDGVTSDAQLHALGLAMIADAIANAAYSLGLRDAGTPMGALECVGKSIEDGFTGIASAISEIAASLDASPPRNPDDSGA